MSLLNQITSSPIFPFLQNILETHKGSLFQSRRSQLNHHHQIFSITTSMISYSLIELQLLPCIAAWCRKFHAHPVYLHSTFIAPSKSDAVHDHSTKDRGYSYSLIYFFLNCANISFAIFMAVLPLYFVRSISGSTTLKFRKLYSWKCCSYISYGVFIIHDYMKSSPVLDKLVYRKWQFVILQ